MYKKLASVTTDYYIKRGVIEAEKQEVYRYGFEVLLSTFVYALIFIVTSIISKTLIPSLLFWLGFFIIRKISGGFHCKTYLSCHLLFFINHILFIVLYKYLPNTISEWCSIGFILIASLLIFLFAPIDNANKPFIKTEKKRFRTLSCIYACILIMIAALNYLFLPFGHITFCFATGSLSAAISLLCGKIIPS